MTLRCFFYCGIERVPKWPMAGAPLHSEKTRPHPPQNWRQVRSPNSNDFGGKCGFNFRVLMKIIILKKTLINFQRWWKSIQNSIIFLLPWFENCKIDKSGHIIISSNASSQWFKKKKKNKRRLHGSRMLTTTNVV